MGLRTIGQTTLENEFRTLAQQWKEDCRLLSSTSAMVAHPAHKAIVELGQAVVPLLLRDLEKEQVHWFEALKAITEEDPVAPNDWARFRP
jgi:hypothetical protein